MDLVDACVELREPTEPEEVAAVGLGSGRPRSEEERSAEVSGSSGDWGTGGEVDTILS